MNSSFLYKAFFLTEFRYGCCISAKREKLSNAQLPKVAEFVGNLKYGVKNIQGIYYFETIIYLDPNNIFLEQLNTLQCVKGVKRKSIKRVKKMN